MKNTLYLAAILIAIMAAVSCNKLETTSSTDAIAEISDSSERIAITITADLEQNTKTTYANGTDFSWTAGDKISVLTQNSNTNAYKYEEFTAISTGNPTSFRGYITKGYNISSYALYPASADHGYSNGSIQFNIPKSKDLTSTYSADLPLVGKKGDNNNIFTFSHCSGATKIIVDNIPAQYKSVTISFSTSSAENTGVKLSGTFGTYKGSDNYYKWNSVYATSADERFFSRKVTVTDKKAIVYIPFATGGTIYSGNTMTVTGHDDKGVDTELYSNTSVKSIGSFVRAQVIPLEPIVICRLQDVDWTDKNVVTSTLDDWQTSHVGLSEMKLLVDNYFLYARVKGPFSSLSSNNFLDIFLCDGDSQGTAERGNFWVTKGTTWYNNEHKGEISSSPLGLSMTFNDINIDTIAETNTDGEVIWNMAFPRRAHALLSSSGTVYVSFALWNNWDFRGCIPSATSSSHDGNMQAITLP